MKIRLLRALGWAIRQAITFAFLGFALLSASAIAEHRPYWLGLGILGWFLQSAMFLWWAIQRMIEDVLGDADA